MREVMLAVSLLALVLVCVMWGEHRQSHRQELIDEGRRRERDDFALHVIRESLKLSNGAKKRT